MAPKLVNAVLNDICVFPGSVRRVQRGVSNRYSDPTKRYWVELESQVRIQHALTSTDCDRSGYGKLD